MSTADAILDQIDRVLADGVSDDAMRWTPDVVDVEDLGPYGLWEYEDDPEDRGLATQINVEDLVELPSRLRAIAKGAVRAVATTNISISSAPATVDGISPTNGDIFLLTGQSTGSENGPRVWTSAGAAMARATNWDTSGEAVLGRIFVFGPPDPSPHREMHVAYRQRQTARRRRRRRS